MEAKFKVGDTVKSVNVHYPLSKGEIIKISSKDKKPIYWIISDVGNKAWEREVDLELIEQPKPEKTADEMFAELGFTKIMPNYIEEVLYSDKENGRYLYMEISFLDKGYKVSTSMGNVPIPMSVHKAIHKKLEELGWL